MSVHVCIEMCTDMRGELCMCIATCVDVRTEIYAVQSCRISAPPLFLVLCVCVGAGMRENWQKNELARELAAHKKATAQAAESAAEAAVAFASWLAANSGSIARSRCCFMLSESAVSPSDKGVPQTG